MPPYLIEIRLFGYAKKQMKKLIHEISTSYKIKTLDVPHITLVGPFDTHFESKLIDDFEVICSSFQNVAYTIDKVETFNENGVVYLNVKPNSELIAFRKQLKMTLEKYCELSEWDHKFVFHSTIANNAPKNKLQEIKKKIPDKQYKHIVIRVTLLKNGYILSEYDFLLHKTLNRCEALNKGILRQTWRQLRDIRASSDIQYSKESSFQKLKNSISKKIQSIIR